MTKKTALITGGNKGIGFEACRQLGDHGFKVFLAARNAEKGKKSVKKLQEEGHDVEFVLMDVSSESSIQEATKKLMTKIDTLDVLVNNAGVFLDQDKACMEFSTDNIMMSIQTNTLGPLLVTRELIKVLEQSSKAQIINVSSGMGQLDDMREGHVAYRLSKTALNAVTCILASELSDKNICVNSICPGWVKTDMGGANATRDTTQGAQTITWLATGQANGATASFFRDMQQIPW